MFRAGEALSAGALPRRRHRRAAASSPPTACWPRSATPSCPALPAWVAAWSRRRGRAALAPGVLTRPCTATRRGVFAWMLFDWANQPFQTLIVTFIFAPWFVAEVIGDPVRGQALWGAAAAIGGAIVAILAPLLGAMADRTGARKRWVLAFSVPYVLGCAGFWLATPRHARPRHRPRRLRRRLHRLRVRPGLHQRHAARPRPARARSAASPAPAGRSATSAGSSRSSSSSSSSPPPPAATTHAPRHRADLRPRPGRRRAGPRHRPARRRSGTSSSRCRSSSSPPTSRPAAPAGVAPRRPRRPRRHLPPGDARTAASSPSSIASMVYRDALAALFTFGGIYAAGVLGWGLFQLGVFGIVAAGVGAIGAWVGGRADRAFGPRPVIVASIWALIAVGVVALLTTRASVLGFAGRRRLQAARPRLHGGGRPPRRRRRRAAGRLAHPARPPGRGPGRAGPGLRPLRPLRPRHRLHRPGADRRWSPPPPARSGSASAR